MKMKKKKKNNIKIGKGDVNTLLTLSLLFSGDDVRRMRMWSRTPPVPREKTGTET